MPVKTVALKTKADITKAATYASAYQRISKPKILNATGDIGSMYIAIFISLCT